MKWLSCLLVVSGPFAVAAAGPALDIVVTSQGGAPLAGIPVLRAQLERPFICVKPVGETGADGRLTLVFEDRPAERDGDPGYGVYRFLLVPKDRPWALSDLYIWSVEGAPLPRAEWYVNIRTEAEQDNWNYGQRQALAADQHVAWKVSLPESRTVRIIVKDDWGLDVADAPIRVSVDLGALSHTGRGAEVPVEEFNTDDRGVLVLPNAGDFVYSFEVQGVRYIAPHPYYMTRVLSRLLRSDHSVLVYHRRVTVPLKLVVSDSKTGRPVAGARVGQVNRFPTATQGGVIGETDAQGLFATESFSPEHTAFLRVQAAGHADQDIAYVPGQSEYTVSLESTP